MFRIATLFLLASITGTAFAQSKNDTVTSNTNKSYYPTVTLPSGDMGTVVQTYRFKEAQANLSTWISQLKRKRKDTSALDAQLELCDKCILGLQGTDKVVVFDSIVVDKDRFLTAYPQIGELGKVTLSADGQKATYTTELGNKMYEPINILTDDGKQSSTFKCYIIENGKKVSSTILDGLDIVGEMNYPFLMSDGVTFYFAAKTDEGYGNYDLYVTRYDSESERFYRAENMGYPYNSYANDYMMVIDDENGIGWFASDRFQPDGKVCIYSFLYKPSRNPYDYENEDYKKIVEAASLRSISSTWTMDNEYERIKARQRLALNSMSNNSKQKPDFEFVVNENFVYEHLSDFHSNEARSKFVEWQKLSKELASNSNALDKMRNQYALATNTGKAKLTTAIQALEQKVEEQTAACHAMEKEIRILENK